MDVLSGQTKHSKPNLFLAPFVLVIEILSITPNGAAPVIVIIISGSWVDESWLTVTVMLLHPAEVHYHSK
jgi:hypothetical protein